MLDHLDTKLGGLTIHFPTRQLTIWKAHKHVRYALNNVDRVDPKPILFKTARWMIKEGNKEPQFRDYFKPLVEEIGIVLGIDRPNTGR